MDKKVQLTNLSKAKVILEAEIERLQIEINEEKTDIETEAMQLLQNGLNPQDYETMETFQSQGRLDFNNLDIKSIFAIDGHTERAIAVLEHLVSRIHLFMEGAMGCWDEMSTLTDTMYFIVRVLVHMN